MSHSVQLLLVGGGHAMLPVLVGARPWVEAGIAVTLLSEHRYLYYSGMVPEYLGGVYRTEEVRLDLQALCRRSGVRWVEARAARLDPTARKVVTAGGEGFPYDVVAFDVGAQNPDPPAAAIQTKPIHHIEALARMVEAVLGGDRPRLELAIAGGGAAGVEIALNLTGRFAGWGRAEALALTIVEPAPRLLPDFPEGMSRYAAHLLERRGAALRCGTGVDGMDADGVRLTSGETLPTRNVLWATGTIGPSLFREAGLPCDARGFVRVNAALQSPSAPRLFAAGDCAALAGHERLAKVGVHAVKQGPVLRENLDRALRAAAKGKAAQKEDLAAFHPYPAAPLILSTGAPEALWVSGPLWLHGRPLLRLKHFVDQRWIRRYSPAWADRAFWQMLDARSASEAAAERTA